VGLSAAEEAGPEAAVLHGVEFGFEADPVFREGRFLLHEVHLFLEEAFALGLKGCFLLFEGRDRLLLQFALELDEVEAFDLRPEAVDLHPRRVALLADLFYLTGPLFEAGFVVLTLLQADSSPSTTPSKISSSADSAPSSRASPRTSSR